MNKSNEIWRVEINGHTLETDLAALKVMVCQGEVSEMNKVAKGNLASIEAGRVPALRRVFSGQETLELIISEATAAANEPAYTTSPLPSAPFSVTNNAAVANISPEPLTVWSNQEAQQTEPAPNLSRNEPLHQEVVWQTTPETDQPATVGNEWHGPGASATTSYFGGEPQPSATDCYNHPQTPPKFVCRACGALACKHCTKSIGTVSLCLRCGEMCVEYTAVRQSTRQRAEQTAGFGLADFGLALRYPFKNAATLFGAAIFYGLLLLAGWQARIVAFGLLFGYITRIIKQISVRGPETGSVFGNDDFSTYDDVIAPIGRGICVTLVTYGPLVVLLIMLFMGVLGGLSLSQQEIQKENSKQQKLLVDVKALTDPEGDPAKQIEAMQALDPANAGSIADGPTATPPQLAAPNASEEKLKQFLPLVKMLGAGIILALLLAVLWAVVYYPMALLVAGFTESAAATLNPLVGLSTMRDLGVDYLKIFAMYLVVAIVGGIANAVAGSYLAPFAMPIVGNLPATFVDGIITFYSSMVLACILGLALYKCADKLELETD